MDSIPPQSQTQAIFVHSTLDDLGLTPAQFRIVAHIARRGECHESIPNMAKVCRLKDKTIKRCLPELCRMGIVEKVARTGRPSLYRITPIEQWNLAQVYALFLGDWTSVHRALAHGKSSGGTGGLESCID